MGQIKILPHLIDVVTPPCEMSDIALKPVTTVTNCVINLVKPDMWLPNSLNLNPDDYAVRGSFMDGLSVLTIHNNSEALSGANCRSVRLIATLVSGVAGLSASSSSKADTLNI